MFFTITVEYFNAFLVVQKAIASYQARSALHSVLKKYISMAQTLVRRTARASKRRSSATRRPKAAMAASSAKWEVAQTHNTAVRKLAKATMI